MDVVLVSDVLLRVELPGLANVVSNLGMKSFKAEK